MRPILSVRLCVRVCLSVCVARNWHTFILKFVYLHTEMSQHLGARIQEETLAGSIDRGGHTMEVCVGKGVWRISDGHKADRARIWKAAHRVWGIGELG